MERERTPVLRKVLTPDAEGDGWREIDGADVAVLTVTPILHDVGVELLEVVDCLVLVSQLLTSLASSSSSSSATSGSSLFSFASSFLISLLWTSTIMP